jgi:hypothetical protein
MVLADAIGWAGAACLLLAYARLSSGRLALGVRYHLLNLAGAGGLAVNGAFHHAWPSTALNLIWLGIGLTALRGRTLYPAAGAAGELPCRGRGAAHDGGDLVEGHGAHVVQHEREPLGGGQRVEDHQQRETDRVGQQRFMLGIDPVRAADDRVGQVHAHRLLGPRLT